MDQEGAYDTLVKASMFSLDHVGFGGITPETVRAFRFLLEDTSGPQAFLRLLNEGSLSGQMYALAGIYLIDRSRFVQAVKQLEHRTEMVEAMFGGCVVDECSVSDLVRMISSGELAARLKGR